MKRRTTLMLAALPMLVLACAEQAPPADTSVEAYEEVPVLFEHRWAQGSHPFSGAAVLDVDQDGAYEIFVGGGRGQQDALLTLNNGRLVDFIAGTGLGSDAATHGATAIDMNGDGHTDLLVAREDGVYLYYREGEGFRAQRLAIEFDPGSVPFAVAVSDIDRDGDGDLYISVFVAFGDFRSAVYNDPEHARINRLLRNDGDGMFTDITESAGAGGSQNTFLSVFLDLDGDGWQDLVLAQNTGQVEFFRNNHDRTFSQRSINTGYGFWMGMAVGDIDRDGDSDLLFSNVGKTIPAFLTRGDLRDDQPHNLEWQLLRNDGDFAFANVTEAFGLSRQGFGWGAVFEDLNHDGHLDLLAAQNYIKWPLHKLFRLPGLAAVQGNIVTRPAFFKAPGLGLANPLYGQSPVIADFDGDGRQDVFWLNMDGPARAFLNRSQAHFLTVSLPDNVTNQGVRVRITSEAGTSYMRELLNGVGLMTDQSPDLSFGLGRAMAVEAVHATWPDGTVLTLENPPIDTVVRMQRR